MKKTIWLAGGGTGGHISPAISIYENLKARGHQPVLFTLERNRDYLPIQTLDDTYRKVVYYRSSPIPRSLKSLRTFLSDVRFSLRLLSNEKRHICPDAIVAFGGYPVFPVLLWALIHKTPFYLHEQNIRHGMITRLFSFAARKVFLSFPQAQYTSKEVLTGNPLRKIFLQYKPVSRSKKKSVTAVTAMKETKKIKPSGKFKEGHPRKILMLGGSQGASDINSLYLEMIQSSLFQHDAITISTGKQDYEKVLAASAASTKEPDTHLKGLKNAKGQKPQKLKTAVISRLHDRILPFIEDVPGEMMAADVILSRAGSGMIFEILWSGKPACFIPYPYAASDHQKFNSLALERPGFYETIDLRPFKPGEALQRFAHFLAALRDTGVSDDQNLPPLNAHEQISEILLADLTPDHKP